VATSPPPQREILKPRAVTDPLRSPLKFRLRCLVDVQVATIAQSLKKELPKMSGRVLDVGAGESPWRSLLPPEVRYRGLDVESAQSFGMSSHVKDVDYYSGERFPYHDASFDGVLCVEVLEHVPDPIQFVGEIARILKPGTGRLVLTVPWSARRHHIPADFHRFTRERLLDLFRAVGFTKIHVAERGSDIDTIANKLLIRNLGLFRLQVRIGSVLNLVLAIALLPVTLSFLIASITSRAMGWGSPQDPLGYLVTAERAETSPASRSNEPGFGEPPGSSG
jgi:SAM-dependent methyltransferase